MQSDDFVIDHEEHVIPSRCCSYIVDGAELHLGFVLELLPKPPELCRV
jgi:hypothetical protein